MTVEINFGTQPADVAVVTGVALLEDDVAPQGASIVAYVNGQECGSTISWGSRRETNFIINVLGAGERTGCAVPGDTVEFRLEDVPAAEGYEWVPYTAASFPVETHHVVAIQDHAWYWFERGSGELPADSINVRAFVDGVDCGGAGIRSARGGLAVVGFSRLIVPSEEIDPGCGRPGAIVSFLVDGLESETALVWEPGLQRIELLLAGDVNCDLDPNAIDAALLLQFAADLVQELACQDMADVNDDGRVDSIDAALILQFEAGLVESLLVSPA
ncbi:MAG: dockerin type I repeat-containing protein [Chloroflexi bacterium]|nr:dockerin type I repeat-containing protein [Chloroflexota bacterium]